MSTPYRLTPRAPPAPHPTPMSAAVKEGHSQRRATRAPTLNPFEKFSKGDFDSWILGITCTLRQALGQEVEELPSRPAEAPLEQVERSAPGLAFKPVSMDTEEEEDDTFEDLFADIRMRRALNKGKGRDPREGPGLGDGRKEEAIEILSASEEEEGDDEEVVLPVRGRDNGFEDVDEDEDEGDELELYEDEEGGQELFEEEETSEEEAVPNRYAAHREEILRAMQAQYNAPDDHEEYGSSDEEPEQDTRRSHNRRQDSPEIIALDSDDDEPQHATQVFGDGDYKIDGRQRGSSPAVEEDEEEDMLEGDDEFNIYDNVEQGEHNREEDDEDPQANAELVDSGDDDEAQPSDDDTSFPPKTHKYTAGADEEPEIRDPWSGPQAYAEDFYSGGDRPLRRGYRVDAHHIEDEEDGEYEGEDNMDEDEINEDGIDDEVFVPRQPETEARPAQIQIRDVWEGPDEYAEDYYSGGDVRLRQGQPAIPDFLELDGERETINLDEDDLEELPASFLPLSGSRNVLERGTSPGSPAVSVSPGKDVVLQGLQNGHASSATLKRFEEEVSDDSVQHRSDETAELKLDVHSDTQGVAELSPELQDVLASPSRRTLSDSETMDADFDLEYPEISRSASMTRDTASVERDAFSANGVALEAGMERPVVQHAVLETTRPTSEDDVRVEGSESVASGVGTSEGKAIEESETVDTAERSPAPEEANLRMEDDRTSATTARGSVEDIGTPSGDGVASEMTVEIADDRQREDTDVLELESTDADVLELESTDASRIADHDSPTEPLILDDQEIPVEKTAEPERSTDDLEYVERSDEIPKPNHHTVTMEEVTDEEADEPLHPAVTVETVVDAFEEDLVKVNTLVEQDEIAREEPNLDEVVGDVTDELEDDDGVSDPNVGDVVEDATNNAHDDAAVNELNGEDAMDELNDMDAVNELDDEDADAYGELEDDDIEVLSISSSGDFPMLPHVEDGAEVEEPDPGEASGETDSQELVIAQGESSSVDTSEVGPSVLDEDFINSSADELEGGAESHIAVDEHSPRPVPESGNVPDIQSRDESYVEPHSRTSQRAAEGDSDAVISELTMSSVGDEGGRTDGASDSTVPQQMHESSPEGGDDQADSPTTCSGHFDEAQTTEDHREGSPAEPSPPTPDDKAIVGDVDNAANEEVQASPLGEFESPTEATKPDPSVDDVQATRSTSPPQENTRESTAEDVAPGPAAQPQSEVDMSQQPVGLENSIVSQSETVEVTQTSSTTVTTTVEAYTATFSAPDNGTPIPDFILSQAPLPETTANELAADSRPMEDVEPASDAQKGAEPQDAEGRQRHTLDDVDDVNYLPSPESLNHTPEIEVEERVGSPSAVQPLLDSRLSPPPESNLVCSASDNALVPSAQLEVSTESTSPAVPELSTQPDSLADNGKAVPGSETLTNPSSSTSTVERPSHTSLVSEITDSAPLENAASALKPSSPTASKAPLSQPTSSTKSSTKANTGKRKRDGPSPKKGPRGGASRKKAFKGKGKQVEQAPLDGGDEIFVKPRKRTKLLESDLASIEGGPRPPVSTSAASIQSGSSASSAARLLQPSSRASSIAASEGSEQTQPSPTTSKPPGFPQSQRGPSGWVHYGLVPDSQPQASSPLLQATSAAQRPFLHTHGKKKAPLPLQQYRTIALPVVQQPTSPARAQIAHTTPAPLLPPPPPPASPQAPAAESGQHTHMRRSSAAHRISIPPPSPSSSHALQSPQTENAPQTPTSSVGQVSQAPTPQGPKPANAARRTQSMKVRSSTTHTPVTRSHCRFHKISLPKEEFGPRVHFIVPGCSLTRYKVIEDEEIEDHGDATYEESQRMVEDIETLGFDDYLISVLKSLVGSEIMQQREVYYLPSPGETIVRHPSTSTTHPVASSSKGRSSGVGTSASISARGAGGETLEDLGLSETDSDHTSSDDSDYEVKPAAPRKSGGTKQLAKKSAPRKSNKSSNKRPRTQDAAQVDEAEEGRDAKKTKLEEKPASQPEPGVPAQLP